jgi:hypothetical protein
MSDRPGNSQAAAGIERHLKFSQETVSSKQDRSPTEARLADLLNERQRLCLRIIGEIDRENERYFTEEWNSAEQGEPPPPEAWRWIQYDPSHTDSEPELKRRLRQAGIGGGGIKATMKALWLRDCIHIRNEQLGRYPTGLLPPPIPP